MNNYSHPVSDLDVYLRINGIDIENSTTDQQGYVLMTWVAPKTTNNDTLLEIIVFKKDKLIWEYSQPIQINQLNITGPRILDSVRNTSPTIMSSFIAFFLSTLIVLFRQRRSAYITLFDEEKSVEKTDLE